MRSNLYQRAKDGVRALAVAGGIAAVAAGCGRNLEITRYAYNGNIDDSTRAHFMPSDTASGTLYITSLGSSKARYRRYDLENGSVVRFSLTDSDRLGPEPVILDFQGQDSVINSFRPEIQQQARGYMDRILQLKRQRMGGIVTQ